MRSHRRSAVYAPAMRHAICLANLGSYADPRVTLELALVAEEHGWEALFLWDHLAFVWGPPAADPWVTLAAVAARTERIHIGTAVTPVARRRPHVLAQQVATLDVLSGGRVIFGAGLGGAASEFGRFGEPTDAHVRASMLDEGLSVLRALWTGGDVVHAGAHYTVDHVALAPAPLQQRLPIWIGGNRAPSLRRASRWEGWIADSADPTGMTLTPDELEHSVATIGRRDDFEVAVLGDSGRGEPSAYARAGATWWLENLHDDRGDVAAVRALVRAGPPR
jgi:alkanesulfonate monooxygenase SsuD/methylene tetrahydromethanopterin reductase-like flavin-dependent oxidoreductase (luciferase family)